MSASYVDNAFLSSEGSEDAQFDVYSTLGIVLPYSRQFAHGSLGLSYGLSLQRYQDFDELDNLNHDLNFSFSHRSRSPLPSIWVWATP